MLLTWELMLVKYCPSLKFDQFSKLFHTNRSAAQQLERRLVFKVCCHLTSHSFSNPGIFSAVPFLWCELPPGISRNSSDHLQRNATLPLLERFEFGSFSTSTTSRQNSIHFSVTHVETATFHLPSSECHAGAPALHSEAGSRRCHGEAGRAAHWLTPVCYMTLDVAETVIRSRRSVCLVLCCLFARGRKTIIFNGGREPRRARCQTPPLDEKDLKKKRKGAAVNKRT